MYSHISYRFCKQRAFCLRRTSTFLSIMNEVFLRDNSLLSIEKSMETSFDFFEQLLIKHSVERSPKSIKVFEREDVVAAVDFVLERYGLCSFYLPLDGLVNPYDMEFIQILPQLQTLQLYLWSASQSLYQSTTSWWCWSTNEFHFSKLGNRSSYSFWVNFVNNCYSDHDLCCIYFFSNKKYFNF